MRSALDLVEVSVDQTCLMPCFTYRVIVIGAGELLCSPVSVVQILALEPGILPEGVS